MFRGLEFALDERPVDDQFRCRVRKARSLPRLDLFSHRLEVPLHAVYSNREDVHEAQMLGVLGQHGREASVKCQTTQSRKWAVIVSELVSGEHMNTSLLGLCQSVARFVYRLCTRKRV